MTIDEAIKSLSLLSYKTIRLLSCKELDSVSLGIEALEYILKDRKADPTVAFTLLPSETLE